MRFKQSRPRPPYRYKSARSHTLCKYREAIAAAKSPPAALLNAKGKLFGQNTHTGPKQDMCQDSNVTPLISNAVTRFAIALHSQNDTYRLPTLPSSRIH